MILIDPASVVIIRFDESVTCPTLSLLQALRPVESLLKETICQRAPDDLEMASKHLREALELPPRATPEAQSSMHVDEYSILCIILQTARLKMPTA